MTVAPLDPGGLQKLPGLAPHTFPWRKVRGFLLRNAADRQVAMSINQENSTAGLEEPGLWAETWAPVVLEGEEVTLSTIVHMAIGTGSMCWSETPTGIFDSEKAAWVAGGAINAIEKLIFNSYHRPVEVESEPCIGVADVATEPEEAKQWRIQRDADKAAVIELILSYRNHASDEEKLRQIRVVMD